MAASTACVAAASVVSVITAASTSAFPPSTKVVSPSLRPLLLERRRSIRMSNSSLSARRSRHAGVCVRATTSSDDGSIPDASQQLQELFDDLKAKYDGLENKSQVWIYGGGALVALWLSSIIVGAVNSIPLVPKVLEFVGLCYSGWFVYRYLLFKSSRKQLATDIEELKLKVTGVPRSAFMTEDDE